MDANDNYELIELKKQIIEKIMTFNVDLDSSPADAFRFFMNAAEASGDTSFYKKAFELADRVEDTAEKANLLNELLVSVNNEILLNSEPDTAVE